MSIRSNAGAFGLGAMATLAIGGICLLVLLALTPDRPLTSQQRALSYSSPKQESANTGAVKEAAQWHLCTVSIDQFDVISIQRCDTEAYDTLVECHQGYPFYGDPVARRFFTCSPFTNNTWRMWPRHKKALTP